MTKYILVGGYIRKATDGGKVFCEELVRDYEEPIKLLDCLFARPKENWEKLHIEDKNFFQNHLPNKKIEIVLANPDKFLEQIELANAIYLRGGVVKNLLDLLPQNTDWQKVFDKKTVAGASAGAMVLSKYYYGADDLKLGQGLGLVPVKVLVHYMSNYNAPNIDWDKAYTELKSYKEDLPLLALKEGEFKIINI